MVAGVDGLLALDIFGATTVLMSSPDSETVSGPVGSLDDVGASVDTGRGMEPQRTSGAQWAVRPYVNSFVSLIFSEPG
jgi:hypothetical protein